jgi:hypothetical protein
MKKLLELEKRLREAKQELEKAKSDKGLSNDEKIAARQERNVRTPSKNKKTMVGSPKETKMPEQTFLSGMKEIIEEEKKKPQEKLAASLEGRASENEELSKTLDETIDRLLEKTSGLNKIMSSGTTQAGSVNSTGGSSLASQIGFGKGEDKKLVGGQKELDADKDGDIEADDLAALREKKKKMDKAEHEDEKEDKELIAEALDRHNEKKHGEKKSVDSAKKEIFKTLANGQWSMHKADDIETMFPASKNFPKEKPAKEAKEPKEDQPKIETEEMFPESKRFPKEGEKKLSKGLGAKLEESSWRRGKDKSMTTRQPAKVTDVKSGETKMVSPGEQVTQAKVARASSKSEAKMKGEAAAAARRAKMKSEAAAEKK